MTSLETTTEKVGKDQVKLRVEVPEEALKPAMDQVYKRWANEIKVPGFRKGKVPRQLIDTRVGPETIREEALRDALPDLYREALTAESIEAIAPPDIEVTSFEKGSPLVFEATVDIRPDIELPDLSTMKIDAPSSEVSESEIDEQIELLRGRFADLQLVNRAAQRGDHVVIDLNGYLHDKPVEGASAPDLLYEVGSRLGPPKLDEQLEGERAGGILKFTDTLPGAPDELSFTVLVKEVKTKKLPPLDDEFAKKVGEFDSMEELRADLRGKMAEYKVSYVEEQIRSLALQEFVDAASLEPPEKLVDSEFEHRLHHVEEDLTRAGITLAQYAEQSGATELEVRSDLRGQAARSVKAELLLEEIARTQEFDVTEEDLGREVAYIAARSGQEPQKVAEHLVSEGRLSALAADVMRRKALEHIVANIQIEGRPEPITSAEEPVLEVEDSAERQETTEDEDPGAN